MSDPTKCVITKCWPICFRACRPSSIAKILLFVDVSAPTSEVIFSIKFVQQMLKRLNTSLKRISSKQCIIIKVKEVFRTTVTFRDIILRYLTKPLGMSVD